MDKLGKKRWAETYYQYGLLWNTHSDYLATQVHWKEDIKYVSSNATNVNRLNLVTIIKYIVLGIYNSWILVWYNLFM